jgi:small subunit ribosomal protein S16
MLKIRLMRIGTKGHPFYRIVVVDERKKRTGAYIDLIGTYNPLSQPKEIKINQEKVDEWTKKGAQMSTGFMRIIGKAPKKLEAKVKNPGKLRSNTPAAPVEEAPAVEETAEETISEETPVAEEVAQDQEVEQAEVTETPETTEEAPTEEESSTPSEEGK